MTTEDLPEMESSELTLESIVAPEVVTEEKLITVINLHAGKRDRIIDMFIEKYIAYQNYLKVKASIEFDIAFDKYASDLETYMASDDDTLEEPELPKIEYVYVPESVEKYKASKYQLFREHAYPSKEEQLDMQFHDSLNGTTVWLDTIKSIKEKYPKLEEA